MNSLRNKYTELITNIGLTDDIVFKNWNELEKAYSSKSRQYHNLNHIQTMVTLFEENKNQLKFPNEVLYAIFYHDMVYKSNRKDNELKSAELAVQILPYDANVNTKVIFDLIVITKTHQNPSNEDEKWMIDFDLWILGQAWEVYENYRKQIRKEYKIYPNILYKPGRKKTLKHFLENEFIFQTDVFRNKYELNARENISKEMVQL